MTDSQGVLDTNVLVSGLLSPYGPPGQLVDALLSRRLKIAYDDRILLEYRAVLYRPRFNFDPKSLEALFGILLFQNRVNAQPWPFTPSPDPDDTLFLEVASAAGAPLVSGNARHFPPECRGNVTLMTPTEYLKTLSS